MLLLLWDDSVLTKWRGNAISKSVRVGAVFFKIGALLRVKQDTVQ